MRGPSALALSCLIACGLAGVASGCGASLRRIHLADAYFERCYAGDRETDATDAERRACWQAWLASWRDGQALERIDYAAERVLTLDPERAAILALALTNESVVDGEMEAEAELALAGPAPASDVGTDRPPTADESAVVEGGAGHLASTGATPTTGTPEAEPDAEHAAELHRRHRPLAPRTSSPTCAAACEPAWVACVDACATGERPCVTACRISHRTCSRGCY